MTREEFGSVERLARLPEEKREAIFRRLDKDGDGKIQRGEMPRPPEGGRPPGPDLPRLDTDHDGSVSYEEFVRSPFVQKVPEERRRRFFERLDSNGDGRLSPEDRRDGEGRRGRGPGRPPEWEPREMIGKLDQDGDGALSFEEFRKAPWIERLGEDEQEDRFEAMDRNKDLRIDAGDFPPPQPRPAGPPRGGGA